MSDLDLQLKSWMLPDDFFPQLMVTFVIIYSTSKFVMNSIIEESSLESTT